MSKFACPERRLSCGKGMCGVVKLNNLSKKLARIDVRRPAQSCLGCNLSWCLKPKLDKAIASEVFWGPMAYAIIGGLVVATLLTLLFLPALYVAWFRVKEPRKEREVGLGAGVPAVAE